jgi:hypothetical protein
MGRGVFRIGIAPVRHGRVEGAGGQPATEKEIPCPAIATACQCHSVALPMMDDDSVQRDSVVYTMID